VVYYSLDMNKQHTNQEETTMTTTTLTGYQTAKVVNEMLAARGLKAIPPQMVYNYIKKGYIPSQHGQVTLEAAAEWADAYVAKRAAKVS